MPDVLLEVAGLTVDYRGAIGWARALVGVGLSIRRGEVLGLVGESGSGKSSVVLALLGLLGANARVSGTLGFAGHDLRAQAAALRGRRIGTVFQDTAAALNPALSVGGQLTEPMRLHLGLRGADARRRAIGLLEEMGIERAPDVMRRYPHQLSGGMKQRVGIAAALATEPELLLLDEPTTALDVTIEAQIMALLEDLRARRGLSMLLVSHNLGLVDRLADRVCVLYAGRMAEAGAAADVLHRPRHPYTKGLLAALPRLDQPHARLSPIPGRLPDPARPVPGCNFAPRCPFVAPGCDAPQPLLAQAACHRADALADQPWPPFSPPSFREGPGVGSGPHALLVARDLSAVFNAGSPLARAFARPDRSVRAVDGVSLALRRGEIVGLVGESGCGKSSLGRLLLRLLPSATGTLAFAGHEVPPRPGPGFRAAAQIVFQSPDTALNPRHTVEMLLARPIAWFRAATTPAALLDLVRLPRAYLSRYPHQLSGGEKQRIGIARALASNPAFLVCDEAVSALDVSVQAAVLNLLRDLRDQLGMAYLFISHDIAVVAHLADRIAVMYAGRIVEEGPAAELLQPPHHPYTELLLASVPRLGHVRPVPAPRASAGLPHADGCPFAPRCARRLGPVCDTAAPPWQAVDPHRAIRCHIPIETLARGPS